MKLKDLLETMDYSYINTNDDSFPAEYRYDIMNVEEFKVKFAKDKLLERDVLNVQLSWGRTESLEENVGFETVPTACIIIGEPKNNIKTVKTEKIGNTTLTWYEEYRSNSNRFLCDDIFGAMDTIQRPCNSIIVLNTVVTDFEHRGKGSAVAAVKEFVSRFEDKIIAVQAGPLTCEYPEMPNRKTYGALIKEAIFLEKVGFRNSNFLHGFEQSISFVYNNKAAKELINYIIEKEITGWNTAVSEQ